MMDFSQSLSLPPLDLLSTTQAVLDSIPAHIAILDDTARIVMVNRAWRNFAKMSEADKDYLGYNYLEVCERAVGSEAAEAARTAEYIRAVLAGNPGPFRMEYPCATPQGDFWFALTVSELRGARWGRVMVTHEDITSYKQAILASAHLAAIVTSSADAILSITPEGRIMSWNASAQQMFGYRPEEIIGQSVFRLIPLELHDEERGILARLCRGESLPHQDTVRLTKEGVRLNVLLTRSPIRDDQKQIIGSSKIARDITNLRQAERALKESEQRYRALSEAQKRFVNDAAHELRAPLTAIQGNLELLTRFKGMKKADREETLQEVAKEAARLGRLVNDMLALARGDAGERLRLEPLSLHQVLREAFATAQGMTNEHTLHLIPLPNVEVRGDRDRLKQLALQLLENALKYTPAGGTVTLGLRRDSDHAEFWVEDTGIGIAPEELPRVFERFYRSDKARLRGEDPGGTGLGLSIAQWIVEQHGGTLHLESQLGRGTVAVVRLPLTPSRD